MPQTTGRLMRLFVLSLFIAMLPACASVPVRSMIELARLDPMTTDPAAIRAGLRVPANIRPRLETSTLKFTTWFGKESDPAKAADRHEIALAMVEVDDAAARARLLGGNKGDAVYLYQIAPADLPTLVAFRNDLATKKGSGRDGHLQISIGVDACYVGTPPSPPVLMSTYIRFAGMRDYLPLARNIDIQSEGVLGGLPLSSCSD